MGKAPQRYRKLVNKKTVVIKVDRATVRFLATQAEIARLLAYGADKGRRVRVVIYEVEES